MTPEEHERPTPAEGMPAITVRPPPTTSKRPPPLTVPPRTKSGQHPAIRQFRAKLESLTEGQLAQKLDELDARIDATTEALKTPLPPKPELEAAAVAIEPDPFPDEPTSH
jgi:hypothetical protein